MAKQDDYIENETEVTRIALPLLPCYKMLKSLTLQEEMALSLEMQEEVAFQKRCEKERLAILKIENILKSRIQLNQHILEKMKNRSDQAQPFLEYCAYPDFYLKQSKVEKENIKKLLNITPLENILVSEQVDLKRILAKINNNIPCLLEVLYTEFDHMNGAEPLKENNLIYKKLHTIIIDANVALKIIFPFLTEEFEAFFDYFQKIPSFYRDENELTIEEISKNHKLLFNFLPNNLKKVVELGQVINVRIKEYKIAQCMPLDDLWTSLLRIIDQIDPIHDKLIASQKKLYDYLEATSQVSLDLTTLPYWQEMRCQFGDIHQCFKQLEQINRFLDSLDKAPLLKDHLKCSDSITKSRPQELVQRGDPRVKKESLEAIPPLDAVFLSPATNEETTLSQKEALAQFFERKKHQLYLWQACIQERKAQRDTMEKSIIKRVQPTQALASDICLETATQLFTIFSRIDKKSIAILNSFFKPDNSCKPQNLLFEDIEKLIKQVGGSIQFSGSGSSHFSIRLPNTYLASNDTVNILGGSYRPHGGDDWTLSAHELCKNAFIKAGITPERIEIAQKMNLQIRKTEVKSG